MTNLLSEQLTIAASAPAHCYIFAGPPNSGKTKSADQLARSIVGRGGLDHAHNIIVLAAESEGKMIKISQVREMIASLTLKPLEQDQRRVVIINSAHDMTSEGVNAVLKILEEPPEGVVFILISSRLASILPTIRSRAQIIRFSVLAENTSNAAHLEMAKHFLQATRTERFVIAKTIHDSKQSKLFLTALHDVMGQRVNYLEYASILLTLERALDHNVNSRLLFEWLALEISA